MFDQNLFVTLKTWFVRPDSPSCHRLVGFHTNIKMKEGWMHRRPSDRFKLKTQSQLKMVNTKLIESFFNLEKDLPFLSSLS